MRQLIAVSLFSLLSLLGAGCCAVCEQAADLVQGEQAADVDHPKQWSQHGLSFAYPGNWEVDTEDEDFDPERLIIVESSGECIFMVTLYPTPVPAAEATESFSDEMTGLLMPAGPSKSTPFKRWGDYQGVGVDHRGTLLILPGSLRIFSHTQGQTSFTAVEQCYQEDMAKASPGFKLIESTFKYQPPSP
jgi:hypothetical protein